MKICTHCKAENNDSANFCRQCGFVFPGVKAQGGLTDVSLVGKVNDLQDRVADSERKCDAARKEAEALRSRATTLSADKFAIQRELADCKKQLTGIQGMLEHERQKTYDAQAHEQTVIKKVNEIESSKARLHVIYIILIIAVGIFALVQYTAHESAESKWRSQGAELNDLQNTRNYLQGRVDTLEYQNSAMSSTLGKIGSKTPLFIGNIYIRNEGENYGATIYSSNTTYINPKVEIFSLIDGGADIYVKFYTPYGLSTGNSSPSGYSYSNYFYMNKNENNTCEFEGWGGVSKGHWSPGSYRFEFYYQGKCIGSKSFTVY